MAQNTTQKWTGIFGATWGIGGVTLILLFAIIRIFPYGLEVLNSGLSKVEWAILLVWCLYMLFTEGYNGFQKQFSPRVVARAFYLIENPKIVDTLFAPLFSMGYFHATKRRLITTWFLTVGIILLIVLVRLFPQPWRGIIDLGVVLGLIYGLATIYYFLFKALSDNDYNVDTEVS